MTRHQHQGGSPPPPRFPPGPPGATFNAAVEVVTTQTSGMKLRDRTLGPQVTGPKDGDGTGGTGAITFPCWVLADDKAKLERHNLSFNTSPSNDPFVLNYPITNEFPHSRIPVGKNSEAAVEGMWDTGGACNMGELDYWYVVYTHMPQLFCRFEELEHHQEKPIPIGGVGAGRVLITHVAEMILPWSIDGQMIKFVVGLGRGMPMTLLIGLPFQIAIEAVIDVANQSCYSKLFDYTWTLSMKRPQLKDARNLDATLSAGKRCASSSSLMPPPEAKKVKGTGDVVKMQE